MTGACVQRLGWYQQTAHAVRATCVKGGLASMLIGVGLVAQQPAVAADGQGAPNQALREALARPITLSLTRVSLKRAIDSASHVSKVLIEYQASLIMQYKTPVTLDARNIPLGIALEHMLDGTNLKVTAGADGNLIVDAIPVVAADSNTARGTISGRIVDSASGRGLSGATVKIVGTRLSALTSDSGRFTVRDVPEGERVVQVRLFGYRMMSQPVTVKGGETETTRMSLVKSATVLSGVVTTATGVQERRTVGNDITVLNADSIMQVAPVLNVTDLLATRVPGLTVQNTSGVPGAPSRLRLRGNGSLLASDDPIVIVDGIRIYADQSGGRAGPGLGVTGNALQYGGGSGIVTKTSISDVRYDGPSALDQIDPNSIETIEVMKGPSATAIYGSDAANGVIVITTKHGRTGPARWNATVNAQRSTLPGDWPTNYYRFGHDITSTQLYGQSYTQICYLNSDFYSNVFSPGACTLDSLVPYQALNDRRLTPLGTGWNQNGSLTVSGGSSALTYSLTGSASNQTGYLHLPGAVKQLFDSTHGFSAPGWMQRPDKYKTYGGQSSINAVLGRSGASITLNNDVFQSDQQQGALQEVLNTLSYQYIGAGPLAATAIAQGFPGIYKRVQLSTFTTNNGLALTNWSPWSWLPLHATVGLSTRNIDNNSVVPAGYALDGVDDTTGQYTLSKGTARTKTLDAGTTVFSDRFVSASAGINVIAESQSAYDAATNGLPLGVLTPTNFIYSAGLGPSQSQFSRATYGWYLTPQLRLNDRLFVSPGFRLDGGNTSGANANTSIFPKMDVSWIALNRQDAAPLFGALSLLRPRIAFGIAGVQPGPTEQLRLSQPVSATPFTPTGLGTPVTSTQFYTIGNTRIHPERSRELEGGADIYLWGDRVQLTLTGYDKLRRDAIQQVPIAPSVLPVNGGFVANSFYDNIGDVRNRGFEASLTSRLVDVRMLQWSMTGYVSHNSNELVRAAAGSDGPQPPSDGYVTRLVTGYPIDGLWAQPIAGFLDANGDGVIAPSEVRIGDSLAFIGTAQPKYEMSLSTSLSTLNNRLTFNTAFNYQTGMTQFLGGLTSGQCYYCLSLRLNNPTLSPEDAAAVAVNSQTAIGRAQTVSALRWQSFSASYIVPDRIAHYFRVANLAVQLQGNNLALHTNYRGKDPNVSAFASGNYTQDTGQLPEPRLWSFGVRIGN